MATTEALLKAEEYRLLPDQGRPTELVRGRLVLTNVPGFRHGRVCGRIAWLLWQSVNEHDNGHVVTNDAGVITARGPDTVRGPDVAFYSYDRLPRGVDPVGYPNVAPEVVFEVFSPSDRWPDILGKAAEYLRAGVATVCILEPETATATVCPAARAPQVVSGDEPVELPEVHADFCVPAAEFFA